MGGLIGRGCDRFEDSIGHPNKNEGHKLMHPYLDTHTTYVHTHILTSKENYHVYTHLHNHHIKPG